VRSTTYRAHLLSPGAWECSLASAHVAHARGSQIHRPLITAGTVDVAPQRVVEFGQVGVLQAAGLGDHERYAKLSTFKINDLGNHRSERRGLSGVGEFCISLHVLAQHRHIVHATQNAAIRRLGHDQVIGARDVKRAKGQILPSQLAGDQPGHDAVAVAKLDGAHVGLEDGEQCAGMRQQQALTPVESQQVAIPILWARCRPGADDRRRPQHGQQLPRTPQDH
jgi:hypothetical protein